MKEAQFIAGTCLDVKDDEDVLIVCDHTYVTMARAFAQELSCPFVSIPPVTCNGEEPPLSVAHFFQEYDVIIALTTLSLGPTDARKKACEKGTRFVSMAGITKESLNTVMRTDYTLLKERALKIATIFEAAETIHVHTDSYTLEMSVKGRHPLPLTGVYTGKGAFGTLPEGEVLIAPGEKSGSGAFCVDVGMVGIGFFEQPVTFLVEHGEVVSVEGEKTLETILDKYEGSRQIAEFALGINPVAAFNTIFEAKKVEGTCHISLGDNHTIGGVHRCGIHMDSIIASPTVVIDGLPVVDSGTLVVV